MPIDGIKKIMKRLRLNEPIRYLIVGSICQLSDLIITLLSYNLGFNLFFANSLGYIFGSTFSYIGHSKFTFKKKSKKLASRRQIISFITACFLGIISGYIVIKIFTILKINLLFAKLIQLFIIALVQYLFNSKVTYKKKF
tara:strand:+ start:486 stop:905 length:420 start_codon:yes stop_codon:yes gene_type:complete